MKAICHFWWCLVFVCSCELLLPGAARTICLAVLVEVWGLRFDMVWQGHNPALRPVVLGSASMMFPSQPSPAILRFKVDRFWIGPQWWHFVRETHCNLRTKYFFPNATWHRSISQRPMPGRHWIHGRTSDHRPHYPPFTAVGTSLRV